MTYKDIMRIIPTVQAAGLVGENIRVLKKKKKKARDLLGLGVTNIVGTSFIKVESDLIG